MNLTDREGRNVPLFVDYFLYRDIRTADYDPLSDPSPETEYEGTVAEKGFLVRPDTDGALYGITLYDYKRNSNSLTGLTPKKYLGAANQWIECRFVKVYAKNANGYAGASDYINVGICL